ncbi:unnamed protein product [Heterosigma akashiwo]
MPCQNHDSEASSTTNQNGLGGKATSCRFMDNDQMIYHDRRCPNNGINNGIGARGEGLLGKAGQSCTQSESGVEGGNICSMVYDNGNDHENSFNKKSCMEKFSGENYSEMSQQCFNSIHSFTDVFDKGSSITTDDSSAGKLFEYYHLLSGQQQGQQATFTMPPGSRRVETTTFQPAKLVSGWGRAMEKRKTNQLQKQPLFLHQAGGGGAVCGVGVEDSFCSSMLMW